MVPLFIDFKDDFNQLFATRRSGVVVFPDRVVKPVPALLIFYTVSNVSVTLHLACIVYHRGYWIALFDHYSLPGDSENPSLLHGTNVIFFFCSYIIIFLTSNLFWFIYSQCACYILIYLMNICIFLWSTSEIYFWILFLRRILCILSFSLFNGKKNLIKMRE